MREIPFNASPYVIEEAIERGNIPQGIHPHRNRAGCLTAGNDPIRQHFMPP
jgi:hypothetical protein